MPEDWKREERKIKKIIQTKHGGKMNVYFPAGYMEKIDALMKRLTKRGVDLADPNRPGAQSKSRLIQYLIDQAYGKNNTG